MRQRRHILVLTAACAALFAVAVPSHACLNDIDSDTLAQEGRGLPDVVRVLTGRFERNPPLFYQMRLRRVVEEIAAHPDRLNLYDDASVACDRLGDDNTALQFMAKKRARLGTGGENATPALREAWYRYYANIGTVRIHQWMRQGANRKKLTAVAQARNEIARALEIKPNAHFNRERYQLAAMNWVLKPTTIQEGKETPVSFADYLASEKGEGSLQNQTEGLSGLIVLGGAWESADITFALANTLYEQKNRYLAYFGTLRCKELRAARKNMALSDVDLSNLHERTEDELENPHEVAVKFHVLRKEADLWQKQRTTFMMTRLKQGRHPDTDTHFWNGYTGDALPPTGLDTPSDAVIMQKATAQNLLRFSTYAAWVALMLFPPLLMIAALALSKKMRAFYARRKTQTQGRTSRPE